MGDLKVKNIFGLYMSRGYFIDIWSKEIKVFFINNKSYICFYYINGR